MTKQSPPDLSDATKLSQITEPLLGGARR